MTNEEKDEFIKLLEEEVHQSLESEGVFFSDDTIKLLEYLVKYNPERWTDCYEYNKNRN